MSIEKLLADNTAALQELNATLLAFLGRTQPTVQLDLLQQTGAVEPAVEPAAQAETKTRKPRTPKPQPASSGEASDGVDGAEAATTTSETAAPAAAESTQAAGEGETEAPIDYAQVKALVLEKAKTKKEEIRALLAKFGVVNAMLIPEDQRNAFYNALRDL